MTSFNFEGKGFEYFKIWIVNILLMIVTLGIYYPWAKVRRNRYFYANSSLEGRNFEYHATGKQLFFGFIIGVGILIIYSIIQNISPIGSGIVFLFFIAALPWLVWRSLKFNMRVTSFSNVLFSFDGKLGGAYFNYMLMPILFFLSLYLIPIVLAIGVPMLGVEMNAITVLLCLALLIGGVVLAVYVFGVMKKKNHSYIINGSRYGQGQFKTELTAKKFMFIALKSFGLGIGLVFALLVLISIAGLLMGDFSSLLSLDFEDEQAIVSIFQNPLMILAGALIYIGFFVSGIIAFCYSTARQRQYVYANSTLDGNIPFSSTLGARQFAWVLVTNFFIVLLTLGLAIPWAAVRTARLYLENTHVDTSIGLDGYVTQKQEQQSSLGEQISDAFDVDVGVGF